MGEGGSDTLVVEREGRAPMIDLRQVGASRRESAYRRGLAAAFLASLLLHSILLLHFPAPGAGAWRQWSSPTAPHIGFAGPEEILPELNPQDSPADEQEALASARIEAGALVDAPVEYDPDDQEGNAPPVPRGAGGRDESTVLPVLELNESFSIRSTSAPTSHTQDFVIEKLVRPEYPRIAIAAGVEGTVRIRAIVDVEGKVREVTIDHSEIDRSCEEETVRAMYQWRFRPYRLNGKPSEFTVIVPFRFRLM